MPLLKATLVAQRAFATETTEQIHHPPELCHYVCFADHRYS